MAKALGPIFATTIWPFELATNVSDLFPSPTNMIRQASADADMELHDYLIYSPPQLGYFIRYLLHN